jgi:hypothetical protein
MTKLPIVASRQLRQKVPRQGSCTCFAKLQKSYSCDFQFSGA